MWKKVKSSYPSVLRQNIYCLPDNYLIAMNVKPPSLCRRSAKLLCGGLHSFSNISWENEQDFLPWFDGYGNYIIWSPTWRFVRKSTVVIRNFLVLYFSDKMSKISHSFYTIMWCSSMRSSLRAHELIPIHMSMSMSSPLELNSCEAYALIWLLNDLPCLPPDLVDVPSKLQAALRSTVSNPLDPTLLCSFIHSFIVHA